MFFKYIIFQDETMQAVVLEEVCHLNVHQYALVYL